MPSTQRAYCLVIKRKNNDFRTVEWNLTKFYQGENLYTLDGIDKFTSKMTRRELVEELLLLNIVNPDEEFEKFAIIFQGKKSTRELKEGTIFKDDTAVPSEAEIVDFLFDIQDNKQLLNEIYNICNFKEKDERVEEFKFVLKQIDLFKIKGPNGVRAALSMFKKISYEKKRTIILKIVDTIYPRIAKRYQEVTKLELKNAA